MSFTKSTLYLNQLTNVKVLLIKPTLPAFHTQTIDFLCQKISPTGTNKAAGCHV